MAVSPVLPTPGGDRDEWATPLNDALQSLIDGVNGNTNALAGKASVVDGKIAADIIPDLTATYATASQGTKADNAVVAGALTIDVRRHGAVVDGVTYDTAAFADAITAAENATAFGTVVIQIPNGNMLVNAPGQITTNGVVIQGQGYYRARIMADGCDAISVAAGVSDFQMFDVEGVTKTAYSTTVNTQTGVRIEGTTASHCQNFVFRNVLMNGFKTGWYCRYLWNSIFENCRTVNGLLALVSYGLSVNNRIIGGGLNVAGAGTVAGSRCIALLGYESETDATPVASEGWVIQGALLDGGEIGVEITGNAHINVGNNIIDHCGLHGVLIQGDSAGTHFGGNCNIHDNYIAIATTTGIAAIRNANTVANSTLKRTRVHHNLLTVYTGASCTYGINQSGANGQMIIDGNSALGFTTADIFVASLGNIVGPNDLKSPIANNVSATGVGSMTNVEGSNGHVWLPGSGAGSPFAFQMRGNSKVASWFGPPTSNTWAVGDEIRNATPASGQPIGWVCTTAGTPGVWTALPSLA